MKSINYSIEIISAPSILGLKPTGVEELGKCLLADGLGKKLGLKNPVIYVPTLNKLYSDKRDKSTHCLNAKSILHFSLTLGKTITDTINKKRFAFVLGGDCSILLGVMPAFKKKGAYGLIFLDAHADFYEPEKSVTGEVADMDLAIVTGRGPDMLTNINNAYPYVEDKNVVHIGQRDWKETKKYHSQDIRKTNIKCFNLAGIKRKGIDVTIKKVQQHIDLLKVKKFWIHFDTDVLSDKKNPAVDYRLPGGLQFIEVEKIIKSLLLTGKIAGISVTIFNPALDKKGSVAKRLTECLAQAFNLKIKAT